MSDENVRGWFVIVHPLTGDSHSKIKDTGTFEDANRIMELIRKGFSVRHKANPKYDVNLQYLRNNVRRPNLLPPAIR